MPTTPRRTSNSPVSLRSTFFGNEGELEQARSINERERLEQYGDGVGGSLRRGLLQSPYNLSSSIGDALAGTLQPVAPGVADFFRRDAASARAQAERFGAPSPIEEDRTLGDHAHSMAMGLGSNTASLGAQIAGAGAGGAYATARGLSQLWGGLAGSSAVTAPMELGSQLHRLESDPTVMENTTHSQRMRNAATYSALSTPAQVVAPSLLASRLQGAGRAAVERGAGAGARHLARAVPEAIVTEAVPEAFAERLSQNMHGRLNPERDTSRDNVAMLDAARLGFGAGAVMSGTGRAVQVARANQGAVGDAVDQAVQRGAIAADNQIQRVRRLLRPENLPPNADQMSDEALLAWDEENTAARDRDATEAAEDYLNNPATPPSLRERAAEVLRRAQEGVQGVWADMAEAVRYAKGMQSRAESAHVFTDTVPPKQNAEWSAEDQALFGEFETFLPQGFAEQGNPQQLFQSVLAALENEGDTSPEQWALLADTFGGDGRAVAAVANLRERMERGGRLPADPGFRSRLEARMGDGVLRRSHDGELVMDNLVDEATRAGIDEGDARATARDIRRALEKYDSWPPEQRESFDTLMRDLFGSNSDAVLEALAPTSREQRTLDDSPVDVDDTEAGVAPQFRSTSEIDPTINFVGSASRRARESGSDDHGGFWRLDHENEGTRSQIQQRMRDEVSRLEGEGASVRLLTPTQYAESAGVSLEQVASELGTTVEALDGHPARMIRAENVSDREGIEFTNDTLRSLGQRQSRRARTTNRRLQPAQARSLQTMLQAGDRAGLAEAGFPNITAIQNTPDGPVAVSNPNAGTAGTFTVNMRDGTSVRINAQDVINEARNRNTDPSTQREIGDAEALRAFTRGVSSILNNPDVTGISVEGLDGQPNQPLARAPVNPEAPAENVAAAQRIESDLVGQFGQNFRLMQSGGREITLGQALASERGIARRSEAGHQRAMADLSNDVREADTPAARERIFERAQEAELLDLAQVLEADPETSAIASEIVTHLETREKNTGVTSTEEITAQQNAQDAARPRARRFDENTGERLGQGVSADRRNLGADAEAQMSAPLRELLQQAREVGNEGAANRVLRAAAAERAGDTATAERMVEQVRDLLRKKPAPKQTTPKQTTPKQQPKAAEQDPVAQWADRALGWEPARQDAAVGRMTEAQATKALKELKAAGRKNDARAKALADKVQARLDRLKRIEDPFAELEAALKEDSEANGRPLSEAEMRKVMAYIRKVLGPDVTVEFVKGLGGTGSAQWARENGSAIISMVITATDPMSKAHHEAAHEFFQRMLDNHPEYAAVLQRAASSAAVQRQIARFFRNTKGREAILKAMQDDPAERVAYMFQVWAAGELSVGPRTQTVFERVMGAIRRAMGRFTDAEMADMMMRAFHAGEMANPSAVGDVLANNIEARQEYVRRLGDMWERYGAALRELTFSAQGRLERSMNPHVREIGRMFTNAVGDEGTGMGFHSAKVKASNLMLNRFQRDVLDGLTRDEVNDLREALQRGERPSDAKLGRAYDNMVEFNRQVLKYLREAGVEMNNIEGYTIPRAWEPLEIAARREEFVEMLMRDAKKYGRELSLADAEAITQTLIANKGAEPLTETEASVGYTPFMASANARKLDFVSNPDFAQFQKKDFVEIVASYISHAAHRAEYARRFGNDGSRLRDKLMQAWGHEVGEADWRAAMEAAEGETNPSLIATHLSPEARKRFKLAQRRMNEIYRAVMANEGTIGSNDTPDSRVYRAVGAATWGNAVRAAKAAKPGETPSLEAVISAMPGPSQLQAQKVLDRYNTVMKIKGAARRFTPPMIVYQNVRLLAMTLFAQFSDPMGVVVRGGTVQEAFNTYVRGMSNIINGWKGEISQDEATQLALKLGIVDASGVVNTMGNAMSTTYMGPRTKKVNDMLFRINGVEAYTQGTRVGAMEAAIEFFKRHSKRPNKHTERYLKELNLTAEDIALVDGELDYTNPKVRDAIFRWVDGAIIRPNSSLRPVWASDPHYAIFFHMKQFTYAFHKVILERMVREARNGNYNPVVAGLAGYVPIMIAADTMRAIIANGGEEPYWLRRMDTGDKIVHGVQRAGLLGIPQFGVDAFRHGPVELLGPAVEQMVDTVSNLAQGKDKLAVKGAVPRPLHNMMDGRHSF